MRQEAKITVNTDEFVAALRSLKVHLKGRRSLELLIRHGSGVGELILELSGKSPYSGMLTTIHGDGDWPDDVMVHAALLRGVMLQPPAAREVRLSYEGGRFSVDNWSCPAKAYSW